MAPRLPGAGSFLGSVGKSMGQVAGKAPLSPSMKAAPTQIMSRALRPQDAMPSTQVLPKAQPFVPPTEILSKPQAAVPPTDIWRGTAPTKPMTSGGLGAFDPENVIDSDFIERILAGTF